MMVLLSVILGASCGNSGQTQSDSKAEAIEKAYKAGVLTEAEYKQKMAALGPKRNGQVVAVEKAYKAGVLSEAEYKKKLAELNAPSAASANAEATAPTEKISLNPTKSKGKTYRHPTGFTFWYPAGWKFKMLDGIVQLAPPDSAGDAQHFDSYYVSGENIEGQGIDRAQHRIVIQYLYEQMTALGQQLGVQFLQVGPSVQLGSNKRAVWNWTAESEIGTIHARTMVTIMGNYGGVIACVGVEKRLKKHKSLSDRIFGSIEVGQPALDKRIIGKWTLKNVGAVSNNSPFETSYSKAKAVNEQTSTMTFAANGQWERINDSHMIAGAGGVWLEDKSRTRSAGQWNADGKHLFMMWQDKSFDDCEYRINGSTLVIVSGKNRFEWSR